MSSRLGSMVVRMVLDGLGNYKADLDKAAQLTTEGATKIEQASTRAGEGITRMGGAMGGAAGTAVELAGAAGAAGMGLGALAAVAGAAAYAAHTGAKEQLAYNQALILTGNISGTTASQMQGMAAGIDAVVGTHYQAAAALTALASTGEVAGSNLQAFAQVAIQTERVVGTKVADTAKVFAQLGEEPVKASIKLNQSMNYLTTATLEQIKAAQELGDSETAASIAQNAYATAMATRTEQIKGNLGTLEKAWIGVNDVAKETWDAMLGLGRPTDPSAQLDSLSKKISDVRSKLADKGLTSNWGGEEKLQGELRALLEQQGAVQEITRMARIGATAEAERVRVQKEGNAALEAVDKANERALTKQQQMTKELDAYRVGLEKIKAANPDSDRLKPALIKQTEDAIAARYAEKPGRVDNSAARELEREAATLATLSGVNANYLAELNRVVSQREKGNISEERYVELVNELIGKQPMAKHLMEENTRAAALADKQMAQSNVEYVKGLETLDKSIEKTREETEKEQAKAAALGLSKIAVADLAAEELERDAAAADRLATRQEELGLEGETTKRYREQAQALRDLAAAKRNTARRETEVDTEKEIANERKKGWEETDRLAREVFVNQENSAKRVGDVLGKALKSAVYEATLKPLVFQIYTAATGGGGSAGSAVGSAASSVLGSSGGGIMGSLGASFGAFGTGTSYGVQSLFANGFGATMSAGGQMIGAGSTAAGLGTMVGAVAPYVMAALVVKELMSYKVDAKGNGLTATLGANGLPSGQVGTYSEFQQTGGLGGGGVTTNRDWSVADKSVADYITNNVRAITASNKAYADAIGLTSTTIDDYTKSIEVNLTGLDAAGQQAAINAELTKFGNEQASAAYGEALKSVARDGETTSVTIARLATDLGGVNTAFAALGYTLYDVSVAGAAAASGMTAAFGSLQNFQAQTEALFQNYYTADEQKANAVKNANAGLAAAGITGFTEADIAGASREQVRAVVDQYAAKKGTTEGDKQYAAVVTAANYLNQYVPGFVEAVKPVVAAATGSSGGGGGGSAGAAVDSAMDEWKRGVDAIVNTMKDLRTTMIASGPDKLERLQAEIVTKMAQAKAGSLTALQDLPQLAKLTSSAYAQQHRDSTDQAVFNARLVESLGSVIGSDGGLNYVPRDAMVQQASGADAGAAGGGGGVAQMGGAELAQAMRDLARLMQLVATNTGETKGEAQRTADILTLLTRGRPYIGTKEYVAP